MEKSKRFSLICMRLPGNPSPGQGYPQTEPARLGPSPGLCSSPRSLQAASDPRPPSRRGSRLGAGQLLTYCKFEVFGQEILQLGDALVNPVASLFLDEPVRQFVGVLQGARGGGGRRGRGERPSPRTPRLGKSRGSAAVTPRTTHSCPFFSTLRGRGAAPAPCRPPFSLRVRKLFLETQRVLGLRFPGARGILPCCLRSALFPVSTCTLGTFGQNPSCRERGQEDGECACARAAQPGGQEPPGAPGTAPSRQRCRT